MILTQQKPEQRPPEHGHLQRRSFLTWPVGAGDEGVEPHQELVVVLVQHVHLFL